MVVQGARGATHCGLGGTLHQDLRLPLRCPCQFGAILCREFRYGRVEAEVSVGEPWLSLLKAPAFRKPIGDFFVGEHPKPLATIIHHLPQWFLGCTVGPYLP